MTIPNEKDPLVLLVDDDEGTRLLAGVSLKNAGFATVEAANGEEGVAACERYRPDLILIDAVMPGMDGFSASFPAGRVYRSS
jgi:CheY-like chemotaxis protein